MSKCMFWKVLFFSMASMTFCHFLLKKIPNFPVSLQLSKVRFLQNSYHLMTKIAHKNSWIASWKAKQKSHQNFIFARVVLFFFFKNFECLLANWPYFFVPSQLPFLNPTTANYTNSTTKHLETHRNLDKKIATKIGQTVFFNLVCSETSLSLFLQHSDP